VFFYTTSSIITEVIYTSYVAGSQSKWVQDPLWMVHHELSKAAFLRLDFELLLEMGWAQVWVVEFLPFQVQVNLFHVFETLCNLYILILWHSVTFSLSFQKMYQGFKLKFGNMIISNFLLTVLKMVLLCN